MVAAEVSFFAAPLKIFAVQTQGTPHTYGARSLKGRFPYSSLRPDLAYIRAYT